MALDVDGVPRAQPEAPHADPVLERIMMLGTPFLRRSCFGCTHRAVPVRALDVHGCLPMHLPVSTPYVAEAKRTDLRHRRETLDREADHKYALPPVVYQCTRGECNQRKPVEAETAGKVSLRHRHHGVDYVWRARACLKFDRVDWEKRH